VRALDAPHAIDSQQIAALLHAARQLMNCEPTWSQRRSINPQAPAVSAQP
jgi:hypothetical protein